MKKARLLGAAVAACCVMACGGAHAASVTLTGWAFGKGQVVTVAPGVDVYAGAFAGTLTDAGEHDDLSFLTYCIELEEQFSFSSSAMTGYAIVDGASYFAARQLANPARPDGAQVADQLGRLLTYVSDNPALVDTVLESAAMQLAVWSIVYDTDFGAMNSGTSGFPVGRDNSQKYGARVGGLLQGAAGVDQSRFDVFALTRSGSQDFLLAAPRGSDVPEPGSLALAGLALAGLTAAGRRRASALQSR